MRDNEERSVFIMCMNVINSLTHWLLGAVTMLAIVVVVIFPGTASFTQHIYLCTIGYVVLMAEAILTFNPYNGWSRAMRYQDKKVIHWLMQVSGSILAITGIIIRITNLSAPHFQSGHGRFGLIALIMTGLSLVGGVIGLFSSTSAIRILHSCAGSLTLFAAFMSLCLGFDKTLARAILGNAVANVAISFTIIGLVCTLCSAGIANYKRVTK